MNRLELEQKIIKEGKKRKINLESCRIYDRGEYLEFYPIVINESNKTWIYKHRIEELIDDLAPMERPHQINDPKIAHRTFKIGERVQVFNLWIKLAYKEKEPEGYDGGSRCGQYREGWVLGEVVETPEQNDGAVVVLFDRDVYLEDENCGWIGNVTNLEKLIKEDKIKKIEKGSPVYCGSCLWTLRKYK
jgi:hypothetical protein